MLILELYNNQNKLLKRWEINDEKKRKEAPTGIKPITTRSIGRKPSPPRDEYYFRRPPTPPPPPPPPKGPFKGDLLDLKSRFNIETLNFPTPPSNDIVEETLKVNKRLSDLEEMKKLLQQEQQEKRQLKLAKQQFQTQEDRYQEVLNTETYKKSLEYADERAKLGLPLYEPPEEKYPPMELDDPIEVLTDQIKEIKQKNDSQIGELIKTREKIIKAKELSLEDKQRRVEKLESEVRALQDIEMTVPENKIETLEIENQSINEQLKVKNNEIESITVENEEQRNILTHLLQEYNTLLETASKNDTEKTQIMLELHNKIEAEKILLENNQKYEEKSKEFDKLMTENNEQLEIYKALNKEQTNIIKTLKYKNIRSNQRNKNKNIELRKVNSESKKFKKIIKKIQKEQSLILAQKNSLQSQNIILNQTIISQNNDFLTKEKQTRESFNLEKKILEEQQNRLSTKLEDLNQKNNEDQAKLDDLKGEIIKKEQEIILFKDKLKISKKSDEIYRNELIKTNEQIVKQKQKDLNFMVDIVNEQKEEISSLQNQMKLAQNKIEDLNQRTILDQEKIIELNNTISNVYARQDEAQEQLKTETKKRTMLFEKMKDLKTRKQELESQALTQINIVSGLEDQIKHLKGENKSRLQEYEDKIEKEKAKRFILEEKIEEQKIEITNANATIQEINQEIVKNNQNFIIEQDKITKQLLDIQNDLAKETIKNQELLKQRELSEIEKSNLNKKIEEGKKLQENISIELNKQLYNITNQLTKLKEESKSKEIKINQLSKEIEEREYQFDQESSKIKKDNEAIIRETINKITFEKDEKIKEQQLEINNLITTQKLEIQTYQSMINQLKDRIDQVKLEKDTIINLLENINIKEKDAMNAKINALKHEENSLIDALKRMTLTQTESLHFQESLQKIINNLKKTINSQAKEIRSIQSELIFQRNKRIFRQEARDNYIEEKQDIITAGKNIVESLRQLSFSFMSIPSGEEINLAQEGDTILGFTSELEGLLGGLKEIEEQNIEEDTDISLANKKRAIELLPKPYKRFVKEPIAPPRFKEPLPPTEIMIIDETTPALEEAKEKHKKEIEKNKELEERLKRLRESDMEIDLETLPPPPSDQPFRGEGIKKVITRKQLLNYINDLKKLTKKQRRGRLQ